MSETNDGLSALMEDVRAAKPGGPRPVTFDAFPWSDPLAPADLTGVAVGMVYQKTPRDSSHRWITVRSVSTDAPQKMMAYCWLRKAVKGFRLDRVQGVYDTDGVMMDPADFFRAFGVTIDSPVEPLPTATRRVSLAVPLGVLAQIDAITAGRDAFIVAAIQAELLRRA